MGLNRGRVGIQLKIQDGNQFIVGFTNDWVNSGKRETFDDGIDERCHFVVGWWGARLFLSPVLVVGKTGCCCLGWKSSNN